MVIPELKRGPRELARRYGPLGGELVDAVLDAFSLLEGVVDEQAIECDYRRTGALVVAHHPDRLVSLRVAAHEYSDDLGLPARFVLRDELHDELGSDVYHGGLVLEVAGGLHPAKLHAGLLHAARDRGCRRPRAERASSRSRRVATKACASSPRADRSKPPTCSSRPMRTRTI